MYFNENAQSKIAAFFQVAAQQTDLARMPGCLQLHKMFEEKDVFGSAGEGLAGRCLDVFSTFSVEP